MLSLKYIREQSNQKSSEGYRINCPECDDDKFHCYCNLDKMVYICFKCGAKGKIVKDEIDISDFHRVYKDIMKKNYTLKEQVATARYPVRNLPPNTTKLNPEALAYLYSRGLTTEDILKYDIRESTDVCGMYANCIIFPVWRSKNIDLAYYVCRRIPNKHLPKAHPLNAYKYINAPWSKDEVIYCTTPNETFPRYIDGFIVEGIFDAIAITKAGYTAYALLGKTATSKQLESLCKLARHGYIVFLDSDAFSNAVSVVSSLRAMAESMNRGYLKFNLVYQSDKDPSDMWMSDRERLKEVLNEANDMLGYKKC